MVDLKWLLNAVITGTIPVPPDLLDFYVSKIREDMKAAQ